MNLVIFANRHFKIRYQSSVLILLGFFTVFCGCNHKAVVVPKASVRSKMALQEVFSNSRTGLPIEYDFHGKKNPVYVTNRNGTLLYINRGKGFPTYDTVPYGEYLDVIDTIGDWFGVAYYVNTGNYQKNMHRSIEHRYEKLYVHRDETGPIEKVNVLENELYNCTSYDEKSNKSSDCSISIKKQLKLEFITKINFDIAKQNKVDFLIQDTTDHPKKNGITELQFGNGSRKYKDMPDYGDCSIEFYYLGQFEELGYYLFYESYFEGCNFVMISKANFRDSLIFDGFPLLTPDKKEMFCYAHAGLFVENEIQQHKIKNGKLERHFAVTFRHWIPAVDGSQLFMGKDGCVYTPIVQRNVERDANGNPNLNFQFLKITIL